MLRFKLVITFDVRIRIYRQTREKLDQNSLALISIMHHVKALEIKKKKSCFVVYSSLHDDLLVYNTTHNIKFVLISHYDYICA